MANLVIRREKVMNFVGIGFGKTAKHVVPKLWSVLQDIGSSSARSSGRVKFKQRQVAKTHDKLFYCFH
jgi:hypothetical protein